jgi:predicted nucleic acid-binding protein
VAARKPDALVDTSAAVALLVSDHDGHAATWSALEHRELGLAGHAWFETYSVLTRLPGDARRPGDVVIDLLTTNFPHSRFLDEATTRTLSTSLATRGLSGGSVYDALVAATCAQHGIPLATRDRRALDTYRAFDIDVELIA